MLGQRGSIHTIVFGLVLLFGFVAAICQTPGNFPRERGAFLGPQSGAGPKRLCRRAQRAICRGLGCYRPAANVPASDTKRGKRVGM